MMPGFEWIIDAVGCNPAPLADLSAMRTLCERVVYELDLHVVGQPLWQKFPPPGGVTGLYLLTESHLACHSFPEHGLTTFNLYCCRSEAEWPWAERIAESLGAAEVFVRSIQRNGLADSGIASGGSTHSSGGGR